MGSDCIRFVSSAWALGFLDDPCVSDFWREIGFRPSRLPENIYFASDGRMLAVYEMFDGATGIHIAIPPDFRGINGIRFGRAAIAFAQESTGLNDVLARIQIDRQDVIVYAKHCGMIEYNRDETHVYMRAGLCQ